MERSTRRHTYPKAESREDPVAKSVEERLLADLPRRATGGVSYEASSVDSRQLQSRSRSRSKSRSKRDLDDYAFTFSIPCLCTIIQYQRSLSPFFIGQQPRPLRWRAILDGFFLLGDPQNSTDFASHLSDTFPDSCSGCIPPSVEERLFRIEAVQPDPVLLVRQSAQGEEDGQKARECR